MATGAIGAAAGFIGNVGYQLYHNGGHFRCVKWGDAGIAAASGGIAGALLPLTGTSLLGAATTGSIANVGGYLATQAANGDSVTGKGLAISAGFGFLGGGIAGKFANPYWFAKGLSPWLSDATLSEANTDALTLGRAVAGAGAGSIDPSSSSSDCGCQ